MALAAANIPNTDGNPLKVIENLSKSTTALSPHVPMPSSSCSNTSLLPTQNIPNPHLMRYVKSGSPKLASPIAGAIIGGTTTATVGGQQLRLVHLVVNASSARSIARSIREGKPIEATVPNDGLDRTILTPVKSAVGMNLASTLQSNVLSSSSSPSSPAIAASPAASSCSDADSASSLALSSSSSLHSSSSLISPDNPSTCTICGKQYTERVEFNAHIKAHLKEKLHNRRNKEQGWSSSQSTPTSNHDIGDMKNEKSSQPREPDSNGMKVTSPILISSSNPNLNGIDLPEMITPQILNSTPEHSILQQHLSMKIPQSPKALQLSAVKNDVITQNSSKINVMDQNQIRPIPNNLLPSVPVPLSSSVLSSNISNTASVTANTNSVFQNSQPVLNVASLPASASSFFCRPNNLSITPIARNKMDKPDLASLLQHVQQTHQNKPVVISPKVMAELAACKPVPVSLTSSATSSTTTSLLLLKENRVISSSQSPSLVQFVPNFSKIVGHSNSCIPTNSTTQGVDMLQSDNVLHQNNLISLPNNTTTSIQSSPSSILGLSRHPNVNSHPNLSTVACNLASSTTVPASPYVLTDSNGAILGHLPRDLLHQQTQSVQDMIGKGILHDRSTIPSAVVPQNIVRAAPHSIPVVTASNQV